MRKRLHTLKTCKQCGLRCTHKNESTETAKRARSVGSTTSLSAKCHVLKLLSWLSQKRQPRCLPQCLATTFMIPTP